MGRYFYSLFYYLYNLVYLSVTYHPLILGRPYLVITRVLINMEKEKIESCVQDDKVTFKVFEAIKLPFKIESCLRVDVIDKVVATFFFDNLYHSTFGSLLDGLQSYRRNRR